VKERDMKIGTLRQLLVLQLDSLLASERHARDTFPNLAKAASAPDLSESMQEQAATAREHVIRLDHVLERLAPPARPGAPALRSATESPTSQALLRQCADLAENTEVDPHVRDAALAALASHVLHHELAGYASARSWAKLIGDDETARTLGRSLDDEHAAARRLAEVAAEVDRLAAIDLFKA
jgi:ferritin-like metal-binding protein YciE